jgi:glucose-6-phosphate 1-dehydrogenase
MTNLVILGGLGDLTSRYLLPAVAELVAAGRLRSTARIIAAGRKDLSDSAYRSHVRRALERAGADPAIAERFTWARADARSAADLRRVLDVVDGPLLVYLALPPRTMPEAVRALDEAGARARAHLVIEKPFGSDLASAKALNALLAKHADERSVHRIDHFLGLQSLRSLVAMRAANRALNAALTADAVARVEITWDETLALEGRASYYDGVGALRDMVQNHLLQVVAAIALDPPGSLDDPAQSRARLEVLRRTRARARAVRARYGAGEAGGRPLPAYVDEDGVDLEQRTETFVSVVLDVDTPRWRGVSFSIRTGKALARDCMQASIVFRPGAAPLGSAPQDRLTLDLQGTAVSMSLALASADGRSTSTVSLQGRGAEPDLSGYARVLDDALRGGNSTSVSGEEAEAQWAIVEPVLDAFRSDRVPLLTYPAGSAGPNATGGEHS